MKNLLWMAPATFAMACAGAQLTPRAVAPALSTTETKAAVVLASEVEWEPLNPARGEQSPKAAALWGDRTGPGPSGFLVKFADGFSSPPHIHNVRYRGVVLSGLLHNGDAGVPPMWMPTASYWTQPAGGAHITAAHGSNTVAYIEIEDGPYLVRPIAEAFSGEDKPINIDESNLVWVDASSLACLDSDRTALPGGGPKVAFLWGRPQDAGPSGTLVRLPAGFDGRIHSRGAPLRAVVIRGQLAHGEPGPADRASMGPGSYLGAEKQAEHRLSCESEKACLLYVRSVGTPQVYPATSEK